jgi:hypothetical protein
LLLAITLLTAVPSHRFSDHEDLDPTPRAPAEPFRFTPGLTPSAFMDPTSNAFAVFANQPPNLFTPTPQADAGANFNVTTPMPSNGVATTHDLQTPNIGISLGDPLVNGSSLTSSADAAAYASQTIQPHQFSNYQPFSQSIQNQFLNPSQYDLRPPSGPGSPMDVSGSEELISDPMSINLTTMAPPMPLDEKQFNQISQLLPSSDRLVLSLKYLSYPLFTARSLIAVC